MRSNRPCNSNQGFTIVESLIAILILGIIMAGGIAFYHFGNDLYFTGLNSRIAASIASSKMEVCKNEGYDNIPGINCPEALSPGSNQPVGALAGKLIVNINPITINSIAFKQVIVTVNWTDPSKSLLQSVSLQTYVGEK